MLFAGIDWSDQALDFELRAAEGRVLAEGTVRTTFAGLADLFQALEAHAPPAEIAIAIEAAQGAWVQSLLDRGYVIYPLNPKTVERFRQTLTAAGNKSDKLDRRVIAMLLATLHAQLKPLRPDAPEIVALRLACQDRVRLVTERTAKTNELLATLKAYYPAMIGFFGGLDRKIALQFLQEFPTQGAMLALSPRRLQGWLKRHGYTAPQRVADMQAALGQPVLRVADHLQKAKAPRITYLATSLLALAAEIAECERQITAQFDQLPEADWYRSLPGAGATLAPALLACLGRDAERFASPEEARALMGTAPVTQQSGRSRNVFFRRGCWKFARRTLQLFAEQSRHFCAWAQEFYEKQKRTGHSHHQAVRALALKWLKILLAMKRTGTCYDERKFIHSQHRYLLNLQKLSAVSAAV